MPERHRLRRVAAHLTAAAPTAAAWPRRPAGGWSTDSTSKLMEAKRRAASARSARERSAATALAPPTTPVPDEFLLSEDQVKQWIAQGYLVLELDDLPAELHEQLYARAVELRRGFGGNMRQEFGAELAEDFDAILGSPKTRGALTSLLGPDFAGNSWNGGVLAADNKDQGMHKDNTSEPCRDHWTRNINLFYYPGPTHNADGPSCFLPGSQYYALDRENDNDAGEERMESFSVATEAGLGTMADVSTHAELDERRRQRVSLLGVAGLKEHRVTHGGGTCVLWHDNVFHRRSRQSHGDADIDADLGAGFAVGDSPQFSGFGGGHAVSGPMAARADYSDQDAFGAPDATGVKFCPCVRVGFMRCSAPSGVSWRPLTQREEFRSSDNWESIAENAAEELQPSASAVLWQPQLNWLKGQPPVERTLPARTAKVIAEETDAHHLGKVGQENIDLRHLTRRQLVARFHSACTASNEADRVRAAVALGHVSATEPSAIAVLLTAIQDPAEGVRRAATHGLAQSGDAAVPALLQLLSTSERLPYQSDKLIFALGRTAAAPSALEEAVNSIATEVTAARQRLGVMLSALDPEERAEMVLAATRGNRGYDGKVYGKDVQVHRESEELRSVVAEGARCLGLLGAKAIAAEEAGDMKPSWAAALCERVVRALTPLLLEPDHAAVFPSRFPLALVANNASRALLWLCSSPKCPPVIIPGATVVGSENTGVAAPSRMIQGFAHLAPAPPTEGDGGLRGAPWETVGAPLEEVRLGLARLCWLEARGMLRGEAQAAVLRQCGKVTAWASLLDASALSELAA